MRSAIEDPVSHCYQLVSHESTAKGSFALSGRTILLRRSWVRDISRHQSDAKSALPDSLRSLCVLLCSNLGANDSGRKNVISTVTVPATINKIQYNLTS